METVARYWQKVDTTGGPDACWPWTASVNVQTGYGIFHDATNKTVNAHRFGAKLAGLVTDGDGLVVDHDCHNDSSCPAGPCPHRRCQNPRHYAVRTSRENVNASHNGNARKTHCPRGHELTPENTRIQVRPTTTTRSCKTCAADRDRKRGR